MRNKVKTSFILSIVIIVSIITLTILNTGTTIYNKTGMMTATITNEVEPYDIDYVYVENMPSTAAPIVLEEGVNGLDYTYDGLNYIHLSDKKNEVLQVGSGKEGEFTGTLTGYGPDCDGCSLVGNVSCRTKEGKTHSLITEGLYYTDDEYGSVRILAADHRGFPCGTIVKIDNGILPEFTGIVLDTGITMRRAWAAGTVWMDVAYNSEAETIHAGVTSKNTKFSVQRWGW